MRSIRFAVITAAIAFALPMHAAANQSSFTAAGTCQLSIPTVDSKVRPRASGYRNEGTTYAFVICSPYSPTVDSISDFRYYLVSMDGASHSVTCTGTSGNTGESFKYSSKTLNATDGFGTSFEWTPSDFGDSGHMSSGQGHVAMTCNLPPNVAINMGYMNYDLP